MCDVVTDILSSTGKATPGWMAMYELPQFLSYTTIDSFHFRRGFGKQMKDASMVLMWSNSDGSITLSQRSAEGHSEPTVDTNPQMVATLAEDVSAVSVQCIGP